MKVILDVVEGPLKGRAFVFDRPDTFIVGRSPFVHCSVPEDSALSRDHFLIEVCPPLCELRDLGSTNGTFVNERRVKRSRLGPGDRIAAGTSVFRVRVEPKDPASPAPEVPEIPTSLGRTRTITPVPAQAPPSCARCGVLLPAGVDGTGPMDGLCPECRTLAEQLPQPVPHYLVLKELGRGGMGVVYLARHIQTRRKVALKLIVPESAAARTAIDRFQREMSVISQLKHPNIVEWLEQGATRNQIWFAMEFVEGTNLEALAKERPRQFPVRQACRLVCHVLKGLEHAHGLGFVHRDIKPENILIGRGQTGRVAKISDFGLAKSYRGVGLSGLTFSGEMRGTIPFMPPEQMLDFKKVLPSADLYSTAATLYFLIAGQFLYDEEVEVGNMIRLLLEESPVPIQQRRPDVPDELAEVLHRCLARDPADRYPTATAMRLALRPFC
ncbi:MAG TPA: FHA domain-containing serine/threonine-protein kinase [Isosphaeraceae bacterium]